MPKADLSLIPSFYHDYIRQVKEENVTDALSEHSARMAAFLENLPPTRWDFRYQPDKWSVKGVVQHIIDAERVFAYRALCLARQDKTHLPGFDENQYALHSKADERNPSSLIDEMNAVTTSSLLLFSSFDEEQLGSQGTVNENSIYAGAFGYIIAGHALHHMKVITERYFK